jgi:hypothetical protein
MSTPNQKEFGPGYDYPNRKFHFWAVILPAVLITALAVALMRHTATPSSKVTRGPIVTCPTQTCPPPGSTDSAKPTQTSTSAAGIGAAQTTVRDLSSPTVTSATASSRPSSPSPSSNLSPKTSPSPSLSSSPSATPVSSSPSATPVLSVTRAMLSQASSAVTHAVILSSA